MNAIVSFIKNEHSIKIIMRKNNFIKFALIFLLIFAACLGLIWLIDSPFSIILFPDFSSFSKSACKVIVCIAGLFVYLYLFLNSKKNGHKSSVPKKIHKHINTPDGDFLIKGDDNHFYIQKEDNITFEVKYGQIVSVETEDGKIYKYGE